MAPRVSSVVLSANVKESVNWLDNVAIVSDGHRNSGGLAGIEAVLRHAASGGVGIVAVAWDMPFVSAAVIASLIDTARTSGASAVVPASASPHGIEPFCAYYSQALLPVLQRALAEGRVAAHAFLRGLDDLEIITPVGVDPEIAFLSVNTEDDLARARRIADAQ